MISEVHDLPGAYIHLIQYSTSKRPTFDEIKRPNFDEIKRH
jgi:hypothetical protein